MHFSFIKYLVINGGSSSLKFNVIELPEKKELISGYFEKIGLEDSFWTTKVNGEKININEEENILELNLFL